jgi:hypothetical protein
MRQAYDEDAGKMRRDRRLEVKKRCKWRVYPGRLYAGGFIDWGADGDGRRFTKKRPKLAMVFLKKVIRWSGSSSLDWCVSVMQIAITVSHSSKGDIESIHFRIIHIYNC